MFVHAKELIKVSALLCTTLAAVSCSGSDNVNPEARLNGAGNGITGIPLAFDCLQSSDADGLLSACEFDFGDGKSDGGEGLQTVVHAYASAGTYTVTLKVVDDKGGSDTVSRQILVEDPPANLPPVASLMSPSAALVGQAVAVDGSLSSDSDGSLVHYVYDYGDGATAGGSGLLQSSHVFATEGVYMIRLIVTDNEGATHSVSRQISITTVASKQVSPVACFVATSSVISGQVATFDASCSMSPGALSVAYAYDFGDGNGSNSNIATHVYAAKGAYTVLLKLVASYADGSTASNRSMAGISVTDMTVSISSVNPSSGGLSGGDLVTVKGLGFIQTLGTTVTLGGVAVADLTVVDGSTITFRVPAGIVGASDLVINNKNGSATLPAAYTYSGGSNRATVSYCPVNAMAGSSLGFGAGDVDVIKAINLPFDLPFFDKILASGSTVYVASNGYISFADPSAKFANATLPSASNPNDLVAVFFDDLNISAGQVYSLTTGVAPDRIWTIEWKNVVDNATQSELLDFSVSFYEGSGDILMQYNNPSTNGVSSSAQSATIGLQKDAATAVLYSYNSVVPGLAPGGKAIRFAYNNGSYLVSDRATLSASALSPGIDGLLVRSNPFQIQFSNPLNGLTVTAGTTVMLENLTTPGGVALNVALVGDKSVLQGYPAATLTFGNRYKVTVTDVVDMYGQHLSSNPSLFACGATGVSAAFTTTFIAGPQSMSFSAQLQNGNAPMGLASYYDKNNAETVLVVDDAGELSTYAPTDLNSWTGNTAPGNKYEQLAVYRYTNGATAVVADSGNRTVDFYNVWTRTAPSRIGSVSPNAGGTKPRGVAIDALKAFVAEDGNESVLVFDIQTRNEVDTDPNAGGTNPIYVPQGCKPKRAAAVGGWIYVTCDGNDNLIRIDPASYAMSVSLLPGGTRSLGVVGSPDGKTVYIGDRGNGNILVWDAISNTLRSTITGLTGGAKQENLAITADGTYLFVADSNNGEITVVDTVSQTVIDRYGGLNSPVGLTTLAGGYQAVAGDKGNNILVRLQ